LIIEPGDGAYPEKFTLASRVTAQGDD
jgi:hypothetical protein